MAPENAFAAALDWVGDQKVMLLDSSTSAVEHHPWMEAAGVAIGTTTNRHTRFMGRPHGVVIGWFLTLDELLVAESHPAVVGLVSVGASASHAPWISAHDVERLAGEPIALVPEATNPIRAMVKGFSRSAVLNQGLVDSRERSTAVQALTFMKNQGHHLDPQQLIVESILNDWPGASPCELAHLAKEINRGKRLRHKDRITPAALGAWSRAYPTRTSPSSHPRLRDPRWATGTLHPMATPRR